MSSTIVLLVGVGVFLAPILFPYLPKREPREPEIDGLCEAARSGAKCIYTYDHQANARSATLDLLAHRYPNHPKTIKQLTWSATHDLSDRNRRVAISLLNARP